MKSFKESLAPSLTLVMLCLLVTVALSVTYEVTKPIIANITKANADAARSEVLPAGAGGFTVIKGALMPGVVDIYAADNNSGKVITTVDKGYGGEIMVMTGIDAEGKIQGIKILVHKETPGLGTKAMTAKHLSQFIGQVKITNTGEAAAANIDAITGATLTSNGIYRAVDKALAQYHELGEAAK